LIPGFVIDPETAAKRAKESLIFAFHVKQFEETTKNKCRE
jgi:hypothetical protein